MAERFDWESASERERDAEIAVRLFGWRWLLQAGSGGYPVAVAVWPPDAPGRVLFNLRRDAKDVTAEYWNHQRFSDWDRMAYRNEGDSMHGPLRVLPRYTTDAAAAFEVLRKVREWDFDRRLKFGRRLENLLIDEFDKIPASADVPMRATSVVLYPLLEPSLICRAALAVVEESNG